jgi:hypothetical protein
MILRTGYKPPALLPGDIWIVCEDILHVEGFHTVLTGGHLQYLAFDFGNGERLARSDLK